MTTDDLGPNLKMKSKHPGKICALLLLATITQTKGNYKNTIDVDNDGCGPKQFRLYGNCYDLNLSDKLYKFDDFQIDSKSLKLTAKKCESDSDTVNLYVLGPTGAGKSTLINFLSEGIKI